MEGKKEELVDGKRWSGGVGGGAVRGSGGDVWNGGGLEGAMAVDWKMPGGGEECHGGWARMASFNPI